MFEVQSEDKLAPIVIVAHRRPEKLRNLLDSLAECPEAVSSPLHIFLDGPGSSAHLPMIKETRSVARKEKRFLSLSVQEYSKNLGLVNSVVGGVSQILDDHDRLIFLEDDLVVSPFFLGFMNDALRVYEAVDEVVSIHGYVYPMEETLPETFFIRGADCWGWATWRRGWATYRHDASALLRELIDTEQVDEFDFGGSYPFTDMLRSQAEGKNDSWAVRWYASAFLAGKVTLYPNTSLVMNTGLDGSGTHGKGDSGYIGQVASEPVPVVAQEPVENKRARQAFEDFFRSTRGGLWNRLKARARGLL